MSFRHLLVLVPILIASPSTHAAIYTVGQAGTPGGCTHTTVQAAVDSAAGQPGVHVIRVSKASSEYSAQAIVITNTSVELYGGYADCASTVQIGRTRLDGTAAGFRPVLTVRSVFGGASEVHIDGIELTGARNSTMGAGPGIGGGIAALGGRTHVSVRNAWIHDNFASFGGGIAVAGGTVLSTHLDIGDNVQIEDNSADAGGGIHVFKALLTLGGIDTVVRRNRAYIGGGLYITGDSANTQLIASAEIVSGGQGADGIISQNTATLSGGGIHSTYQAQILLYTTDPLRPVRIDHNSAEYGAGVYLYNSYVAMWEGVIEANVAARWGAAIGADLNGLFYAIPHWAMSPSETTACAETVECNLIADNVALDSSAAPQAGAVAGLASGALVGLISTRLRGNFGNSLFEDFCVAQGCDPSNILVTLTNTLIDQNAAVSRIAYLSSGTAFTCTLCTASAQASSTPLFDSRGSIELDQSIIWAPGRDIIGGHQPSALFAHDLLVHDASDFPAQVDIRVGNPRFVESASGNFRLGPDSPALDSAASDHASIYDIDGNPRVVDIAGVDNGTGPLDLGAYERPLSADVIFADGFQ